MSGLRVRARSACSERSRPLTLHPAQGYASSADFSGKRAVLVLFINGRPVECAPLRRALEATYASVLPKAAKPFVFLVGFPVRFLPASWALPAL
jgi:DNA mismatch repair ATPase MutL